MKAKIAWSKRLWSFRSTICVQPWSLNVFSRRFTFRTRQFRLDQWKCFVWNTKLWMFVKEMKHVLFTCSAGLTKLTSFFRVLEAWCHCDFRKMEALKVNKFGRTYRTGTQAVQARCEELLFFKNLYPTVQLVKRDIVQYRRHVLLHNDQVSLRETCLSVWSCYIWGKTLTDILTKILIFL